MSKEMAILPVVSEKLYAQSADGIYAFLVPRSANKHTVKFAVESQFKVKVSSVNVTNIKGKAKRFISAGGRSVSRGSRNNVKKAYVSLAKGDHIPIFASAEETAKVEKAAEKAEKKDKK